MKQVIYTSSFKKTAKKHKREYSAKELDSCLNTIAKGEKLDIKYQDHQLRHKWKEGKNPYREFHITNRLAVVYLILNDSIEVHALGTHKELDLGESLIKN